MPDNEEAIESAIESAFGGPVPPAPVERVREAQPTPTDKLPPDPAESLLDAVDPDADDLPLDDAQPETPPLLATDPEYVVEVDGRQETVKGQERVKELLQKGLHYSQGSEEVARVREQLAAQAQSMQLSIKFQQEVVKDVAALQAMDDQLAQYANIDWAKAIDTDFTQVLKLQEQRNALKEARANKLGEINAKQTQFQQGQAQAAQRLRASEEAALLAKLPEWRDSGKASAEKQAIVKELVSYGFQETEIANLTDHRAVLLARDAMKWRALQRNKMEKVRQAREAPPVVKPGAAAAQADPNSKAGYVKFQKEFRQQGRAGNHRAQETALEKVFSRTFK